MATRSAPAVDGTPTFQLISARWIDASGDKRAVSLQVDAGTTAAEVDAFLDNTQNASNASLYEVRVEAVYFSQPQTANATAGVYPSVYDNVVLLLKNQLNISRNWFIPAPDATIMDTDSDTPNTVAAQLIAASVATAIEGTSTDDWSGVSTRFTERREKNQAVPI